MAFVFVGREERGEGLAKAHFFFQLMRAGPFFLRDELLHWALVGRHAG